MRKDATNPNVASQGLIARLRIVHVGILLIIAAMAAFGHLMTLRALDRNREAWEVVDLASRVAVRSQTLVSYAQAFADQSTSPWNRELLRARLAFNLTEWNRDSAALSRFALRQPEARRLSTDLQESETIRIQLVKRFQKLLSGKLPPNESVEVVQEGLKDEEQFLARFLPMTDAFRELSIRKEASARSTMVLSLVIVLLALAVEGLFIFRPMLNRVYTAAEAQKMIRFSEMLRAAIEGSFDAFFLLKASSDGSPEFRITEANSIASEFFGIPKGQLVGVPFANIVPEEIWPILQPQLDQSLREGAPCRLEIQVGPHRSRARWVELQVAPVPDGLAVTVRDLTQHKQSEQSLMEEHLELRVANEQLSQLAATDPLTGLYNRRALMEMLAEESRTARMTGSPVGVIMADLDDFKALNDRFGHLAGDQVLKDAAAIIKNGLRPSDFAARFGGEEFAIVLRATDLKGAMAMAERLRQTVGGATRAEGSLALSLGVASWVPAGSGEDLLRAADAALYEAKAGGKNQSRAAKRSAIVQPKDDAQSAAPVLE